jgi:UDP-GlcNAc:undecaprenyl-phosphate GlcNAc-1-phosphate transferase
MLAGVLDDRNELPANSKLIVQVGAALIMTLSGGIVIERLGPLTGGGDIVLMGLAVPFTVFATVGVINALNMADGMDGLAGGLALIPIGVLAYLAFGTECVGALGLLLVLAGIISGFLCFNQLLGSDSPQLAA